MYIYVCVCVCVCVWVCVCGCVIDTVVHRKTYAMALEKDFK